MINRCAGLVLTGEGISSHLVEVDLRQNPLSQRKPDKLDIRADAELVPDERMQIRNGLGTDVKRSGDFPASPFG